MEQDSRGTTPASTRIRAWWMRVCELAGGARWSDEPEHLARGRAGEQLARKFLMERGLGFLTANFRSKRGELDLVFRDGDCLVFVEVKTRSSERWGRPAASVDPRKRRRLIRAAHDYLRLLDNPRVKYRFDIVEVVPVESGGWTARHIPMAFNTRTSDRSRG